MKEAMRHNGGRDDNRATMTIMTTMEEAMTITTMTIMTTMEEAMTITMMTMEEDGRR